MISSIELSNFQSHKSSTLELAPGINIIIGSSDTGKTAVLRALRWLFWNRPSGDTFRSTWGGDTKVTIQTDQTVGWFITRLKNSKVNKYILEDDRETFNFDAIKTDVPAEVVKALNIADLNVQDQFARPFLLDESPGQVAQFFNAIAHLDVIDTATANVARWLRAIQQDIDHAQRESELLAARLEAFAGLDDLDHEVAALEKLEEDRFIKTSNCGLLQRAINDCLKVDADLARFEHTLRHEPAVTRLLSLFTERRACDARKCELTGTLTDIDRARQGLDKLLVLCKAEKRVDTVLSLIGERTAKTQARSTLNDLALDLERMDVAIKANSRALSEAEVRFDKTFPDRCPLCGKPK